MGWFSKMIGVAAAGYVAKRAHNSVSRPTVVMESSDYELIGMKAKGMSEWEIRFRKKGTNFTESMTVNRNTTHTTRGGGIEINWG